MTARVSSPPCSSTSPTFMILPPEIAISATFRSAPVPSMTVPFLMMRSYIGSPKSYRHAIIKAALNSCYSLRCVKSEHLCAICPCLYGLYWHGVPSRERRTIPSGNPLVLLLVSFEVLLIGNKLNKTEDQISKIFYNNL